MIRVLIISFSIILLFSCKTQKAPQVTLEKSEVMDSVVISKEEKRGEKVNEPLFKTIVQPEAYSIGKIGNLRIYDDRFENIFESSLSLFYAENNYEPKWITSTGPKPIAFTMYKQLRNATLNGLDTSDFQLPQIHSILNDKPENPQDLEKKDILISCNAILYIIQLKLGTDIDNVYKKRNEIHGLVEGLANTGEKEDLSQYIEHVEPDFEAYKKLKIALQNYLEYENKIVQDYFFVASGPIKPGEYSKQIPEIRERLLLTEPIEKYEPDAPFIYDEKLVSAVKFFKMRHGLETDGIINKETLEYLNEPLSKKTEKIRKNLNRMKDPVYPDKDRNIKIIVPEYMLRVYEDNEVQFSMKVIVGKEDWPTPLFEDTLQQIVFSPTWTVPSSIATEEMLTKLKRNPYYYSDGNYKFYYGWHSDSTVVPSEVDWKKYDKDNFPFKIVQQPGPANALGKVKFIMPNKYYVYLHDTPADYLFERKDRSLSHGCIRLEEPVKLAMYLLEDDGFNREEILEKMNQKEPETIYLRDEVPVNIVYRTAWVDNNGFVNFRKDIYDVELDPLYEFKREIN